MLCWTGRNIPMAVPELIETNNPTNASFERDNSTINNKNSNAAGDYIVIMDTIWTREMIMKKQQPPIK